MSAKEARALAKALQRRGLTVTFGGTGHYRARHPSEGRAVTFPATPGRGRWLLNAKAEIRRELGIRI